MSHAVEKMMYVGATPWHGLGTKLDKPPTTADALIEAGINWEANLVPLVTTGTNEATPMFANVRSSDGSHLGYVGSGYTNLQPKDAMAWFDPYVTSGEVTLESAGSLHDGKHIWILARIQRDPVEIVPGDAVMPYLLVSTSYDGSRSSAAGFSAIRVVCQNTLNAAHGKGGGKLIRVRHTKHAELALREIRESIDLVYRRFQATGEQMRTLANHGCSVDDLRAYVGRVFRSKDADITQTASDTALRSDRLFDSIEPLFLAGLGNKGETAWDAFNGVTQYLTWERGRSQDSRLTSLWLGDAGTLADKALTEALAMVAGATPVAA